MFFGNSDRLVIRGTLPFHLILRAPNVDPTQYWPDILPMRDLTLQQGRAKPHLGVDHAVLKWKERVPVFSWRPYKFLPCFDACWLHHIFSHVLQVSVVCQNSLAMTQYFSGQERQLSDQIRLWSYYLLLVVLKVSNWGRFPLRFTHLFSPLPFNHFILCPLRLMKHEICSRAIDFDLPTVMQTAQKDTHWIHIASDCIHGNYVTW